MTKARSRRGGRRWVRTVKTASTFPPSRTFTGSAEHIARTMASERVSPKGLGSGIRMIQYFINRWGEELARLTPAGVGARKTNPSATSGPAEGTHIAGACWAIERVTSWPVVREMGTSHRAEGGRMMTEQSPSTPVLEVIRGRRSIARMKPDPVPRDLIMRHP